LSLKGIDPLVLFGQNDTNLKALERHFGVRTHSRGSSLVVHGNPEALEKARTTVNHLMTQARKEGVLTPEDLEYALSLAAEHEEGDRGARPAVLYGERQVVRVRSVGQARYVRAMEGSDIVFSIGPAGTGKTYLAVAVAVRHLREKKVDRIILARPAVEAGESLGFLPGDLQEKVDPYLRPLYDALHDFVSFERLQKWIQLQVVEIAPLAYMRGRTLQRAFVILDEAQNTTLNQMKMFLTRLGPESKAVVTGDITQIDLDDPQKSGLVVIQDVLGGVDGVSFVYLSQKDVVRHRLVKEIIGAFHRYGRQDRNNDDAHDDENSRDGASPSGDGQGRNRE
jgi:phosphate starvation-inducible PhoH-like protein